MRGESTPVCVVKPDVIFVLFDNQLISLVAKETPTIPIVALIPSLDAGFVRNVARPEGNFTGVAGDAGIEMQGKHLDILLQAVPTASHIDDWEGAWGMRLSRLSAGLNLTEFHAYALTTIEQPPQMEAGERIIRMRSDKGGECRHGGRVACL
jgi:hypothetical protein